MRRIVGIERPILPRHLGFDPFDFHAGFEKFDARLLLDDARLLQLVLQFFEIRHCVSLLFLQQHLRRVYRHQRWRLMQDVRWVGWIRVFVPLHEYAVFAMLDFFPLFR